MSPRAAKGGKQYIYQVQVAELQHTVSTFIYYYCFKLLRFSKKTNENTFKTKTHVETACDNEP